VQFGWHAAHVREARLEAEHVDPEGGCQQVLDHFVGAQAFGFGQAGQVGREVGVETHRQVPEAARLHGLMTVLRQHLQAFAQRGGIGFQGVVMHRERAERGHHIGDRCHQRFCATRLRHALGQAHHAGVDGRVDGAAELQRPGAVAEGEQAGGHVRTHGR